jgi:hypothetical protein
VPRDLGNDFRRMLEAESAGRMVVMVAIFSHDDLDTPIRIVNDTVDWMIGGNLYYGAPFECDLVDDTDGVPRARISCQNADRRVGLSVEDLVETPTVTIRLYDSNDFDLDVEPRVETGTATVEYEAGDLEFTGIEITLAEVSGDLVLRDYGTEPWPKLIATPELCPGLFL